MKRTTLNNCRGTRDKPEASSVAPQEDGEYRAAAVEETLQVEHRERMRAEEDLRAACTLLERRTAQLQALAVELTHAEHRERRRLAEVLHDDLQQLLVAARHRLGVLRGNGHDETVVRAAKEVDGILEQCLRETRRLTVELSPPVLHTAGLAAALNWLGSHMRERHGLAVTVEADPEAEPADENLRPLLFQAVRELLFNVVKHAHVDRAQVMMTRSSNEKTRIDVCDAGVGFDPAQAEARMASDGGFGLFSIRGRLVLLGGEVEISSGPGRGTRAVIRVPRGLTTPSRR